LKKTVKNKNPTESKTVSIFHCNLHSHFKNHKNKNSKSCFKIEIWAWHSSTQCPSIPSFWTEK